MQAFPHRYHATATAAPSGDIPLISNDLAPQAIASPAEFEGPGDRWSPETLLTGAVASCFILTFRSIAKASRLRWTALRADVTGTLDRIDKVTQFTGFELNASLDVPEGTSEEAARRALEKAEQHCLISSSLKGPVHLHAEVHRVSAALPLAS
jgi:organic hydroperoxide reductase OsmC/OhrA